MSACNRRPLLLQALAILAVRIAGPRVMPGQRQTWQPALTPDSWRSLLYTWQEQLGSFDNMAVYERPQASRTGLAVVPMYRGRPTTAIKIRFGSDQIDREKLVLAALDGSVGGLRVPKILASGETADGWTWMAMDFIARGRHRPTAVPHQEAYEQELTTKLATALARTTDFPAHWQPMHGDLTPWNLRTDRRNSFLIDWEDAAWGPPRADFVYHAITAASLTGAQPVWHPADEEARSYWRAVVSARPTDDEDSHLRLHLLRLLA